MITILKSPTADTRTCDVSTVSKEVLFNASRQHIDDVARALSFFQGAMTQNAAAHDWDKLANIDAFYSDFQTKFKQHGWWDRHRVVNRHHLAHADGIRADVNLLDVLEYIADCVTAGLARTGTVYPLELPPDLLQRAFQNTVELLKNQYQVIG